MKLLFELCELLLVRDHLPLQQGLRQVDVLTTLCISKCTRPLSTTTRIKTCKKFGVKYTTCMYETIFHYNKD